MTLIIGVRCNEGIVIGADSMVTVGSNFSNIQMSSDKIHLFGESGIAAFAGDVGLGQIVLDYLDEQWPALALAKSKNETKDILAQAIGSALVSYHNLSGNLGGQLHIPDLMVALPVLNMPTLSLFARAIPAAEAREGMYFLTAGSGAHLANSFLKFLEKIFWQGKSPTTIGEGVFSALWTLNHVIEVNAVLGVGGSPAIAVLENTEQGWNARLLHSEEIEVHQELIDEVEESLGRFWAELK